MKTDIKKDQKILESIVQRYGKDDVLKYLNEGFNDSFDDNESDYTDIMNNNDNNTRKIMEKSAVIKSILSGKNTSMAINLNNHNIFDENCDEITDCCEKEELNEYFVLDRKNKILYSFEVLSA